MLKDRISRWDIQTAIISGTQHKLILRWLNHTQVVAFQYFMSISFEKLLQPRTRSTSLFPIRRLQLELIQIPRSLAAVTPNIQTSPFLGISFASLSEELQKDSPIYVCCWLICCSGYCIRLQWRYSIGVPAFTRRNLREGQYVVAQRAHPKSDFAILLRDGMSEYENWALEGLTYGDTTHGVMYQCSWQELALPVISLRS